MAFQSFDTVGPAAGGGGYGGFGYGGGLGAFGGAVVGGLLGPALFGRGGWGGGCGDGGGWGGGGIAPWTIEKEVSDTRRDVAVMPYIAQNTALEQTIGLNERLANMQAGAAACCCETQKGILENRYLAEKEIAGLAAQQAACCCETQLREQANYGALAKQIAEIGCLVKDTENREIIRDLTRENANMSRALNTAEIIAAMKPVAPVPAYIQANPYENFLPTVKVAPACGPSFNNCGGFQ